jgi:hypothetical protein
VIFLSSVAKSFLGFTGDKSNEDTTCAPHCISGRYKKKTPGLDVLANYHFPSSNVKQAGKPSSGSPEGLDLLGVAK